MLPLQFGDSAHYWVEEADANELIHVYILRYGGRAVTEECPMAIIVMSFQSIVGVVIQVHTLRKYRNNTIMFGHLGLFSWHFLCQIYKTNWPRGNSDV